jgi:hypothetical protein
MSKSQQKRRRLALPESLESRIALSADGVLWGNDARLTISFAPDGTSVEGQTSELFATFDAVVSRNEWQSAILKGFQNWAIHTNSDIGLVSDNGADFGIAGATHQDPRFGDVRVGAVPLDDALYAVSISFDEVVDGTWAGELLFNSNANIDSLVDILAISAHEAGNIFGLEDSTDPQSPLYDAAIPTAADPTPADIANLQSMHGPRLGDIFDVEEVETGDLGFIEFKAFEDAGDRLAPSVAFGEISGAGDTDVFEHEFDDDDNQTPGEVSVQIVTDGISQLAPSLAVRDQHGNLLTTSSVTAAAGENISYSFTPSGNVSTLVLEVGSAETGVHSVGSYSLVLSYGDALNAVSGDSLQRLVNYPQRMVELDDLEDYFEDGEQLFVNDDGGTNNGAGHETVLETVPGFVEGSRYQVVASINLQSVEVGQFSGALQVYDSAGNAIDSTIIIHNDDQMTVQFPIEAAAQSYVVEIMADAESPDMTGTYELVARFGTEPVVRDSFVHGYLSPLRSSRTHQLTVDRSQLFHFIFSADSNSATNDSILTMTVRNAAGESVLELSSRVGDARSATTLLSAGRYSVTIETTYQSAHSTPVSYNLSGAVVDDPLGPRLNDTTEDHFDFDTKRLILATFFPF